MKKFPIVENAKQVAAMVWGGIAVPTLVEIPDGRVIEGEEYVYGVADRKRYLVTEKVLKFNRKALRNPSKSKKAKTNPRILGGEDTMIVKVGKPGDWERVEALRSQYEMIGETGEEVSPFGWEG